MESFTFMGMRWSKLQSRTSRSEHGVSSLRKRFLPLGSSAASSPWRCCRRRCCFLSLRLWLQTEEDLRLSHSGDLEESRHLPTEFVRHHRSKFSSVIHWIDTVELHRVAAQFKKLSELLSFLQLTLKSPRCLTGQHGQRRKPEGDEATLGSRSILTFRKCCIFHAGHILIYVQVIGQLCQ